MLSPGAGTVIIAIAISAQLNLPPTNRSNTTSRAPTPKPNLWTVCRWSEDIALAR